MLEWCRRKRVPGVRYRTAMEVAMGKSSKAVRVRPKSRTRGTRPVSLHGDR